MKKNSIALMKAILSTFAILIALDPEKIIDTTNTNVMTLTYFVVGVLLYFFYSKIKIKEYCSLHILSVIFALFMVFGYSYELIETSKMVFGNFSFFLISICKFLGYYFLFNKTLSLVYEKLLLIPQNESKKKVGKMMTWFENHPFLFSVLVVLVCWLAYIIAFYPAILSPDPSNQIKMFFGFPTHYITGVNLIDPNVVITNHHPFFHTCLLGGLAKFGYHLGNINFGLFLYSIIQILVLSSTLAYTIKYMFKLQTNRIIIFSTLIIYALVPVFPLYAMSAVKDVLFGSFLILYAVQIFDLIKYNDYTYKQYFFLFITMVLVCLMRNNGIYTIIFSFPWLFLILRKKWRPLLCLFLSTCIVYVGFNKVLLPHLKITEGSIREMLSIPFQQTARYVKYHGEEVTEEEKKVIDKILTYDTLADRYKPNLSDSVKNAFNKDATMKDLKTYFSVWFKMFFKHPDTYLNATINNVYGYFYPNTTNWYIYYNYDKRLSEVGLDYHYNNLSGPRKVLSSYGLVFPYIPVIGVICNIGFVVWCYLFMLFVLFIKKNYKYLIIMAIPISLILVCIAGPANTYFRYALPYVFALPIFFSLFLNIIKDSKN